MLLLDQNRISYSAHRLLDNNGPVLSLNTVLSTDAIINILIERQCDLNPDVVLSINIIRKTLNLIDHIDKFSGIFIHNAYEGYVIIKGSNQDSNNIVSIKIN
jgi:hypothetical protein